MKTVYSGESFVAMIHKQDNLALGFVAETPWLLLRNTGRTDRFATMKEAREEARKTWPRVSFKIEGV